MSRRFVFLSLLFLSLVSCGTPLQENCKTEHLKGIWQGTLKVEVMELRLVFKVSLNTDGSHTATLDSPDQGAKDIPVSEVTLEDCDITIDVKAIQGVYEGKFSKDRTEITGHWKQGRNRFPLALKKVGKPPSVSRPQEPKKPYPYDEVEVFYENKKAGVRLAGTLTLPHQESPFPAVLLISGSGAQDRNETVFGHRPFLVLADYLSRHGIAVLRVDDRGVGGSSGNTLESTIEDLSGDVLAGIDYLKKHEKINPENIGLIGHSEGGIIAPMVAVESEDVSFIVLMAGTGLTLEEFSYLQVELISRSVGKSEEEIAENRAVMEKIYEVVKKEKDNERARKKLLDIYESSLAGLSEAEKESIGDLEVYINNQIQNVLSPGIRYLLTYDPRATLIKVKCPVLAIIGEKDLHVSPEENLRAIEEALLAGGNKDFTVKMLPGLNHLFQTTETGLISEYGKIEETISPTALKLIGDWILEKIKSP